MVAELSFPSHTLLGSSGPQYSTRTHDTRGVMRSDVSRSVALRTVRQLGLFTLHEVLRICSAGPSDYRTINTLVLLYLICTSTSYNTYKYMWGIDGRKANQLMVYRA